MQLEHEFTVAAPIDEVWQALLDPERVAPCLPGATLTDVSGQSFTGKVKVKLGPISLQYSGSGEFADVDNDARTMVIKAAGKDTRGAGTASTESTVTLTEQDGGTHGAVVSDVKVTGRPAQFGRGLISEVAGKLLAEFASNLAAELRPPEQGGDAASGEPDAAAGTEQPASDSAGPAAGSSARQGGGESLDLMQMAGAPLLKRLGPALAAVAVLLLVIAACRSRRQDD